MKQGKCIKCKIRWVSDKDFGRQGVAKCPNCENVLRQTVYFLTWPVRIHPNATKKYRNEAREKYAKGKKILPGYGYEDL